PSAVEIAERQDLYEEARAERPPPVEDGRQALPSALAIGGRLEPAHPADGIVALPLGIGPQFPRRWSRSSGSIPKYGTGALAQLGHLSSELNPVLWILVSASIDEVFELAI